MIRLVPRCRRPGCIKKRVEASNPNCHHTYPKTHAHGYSLQPHSPSDLESALQPRGLFMKFVMTRPDQVDGSPEDQTAAVRPGEALTADLHPEDDWPAS